MGKERVPDQRAHGALNDDDRIRALLSKVNSDFSRIVGTKIIPQYVSKQIIESLEGILEDLKAVRG